jgi:hypothetical protein
MAVTATNLIQGPATMYLGIFGVTEPATIATVPGAGWLDVGGTQDGVNINVELEFSELSVDQIVDIPGQRITKRVAKVKTNLAEVTLANVANALNELAATIVANKFTPSNGIAAFSPNYSAVLLDGIAPGGFRRRVIVRKVLQIGNVESAYKKDGQTLLPVEFASHYVSSSIAPFIWEDATS